MQLSHCTDPAIDFGTKVRILVGAQSAYVCVTETSPPASADYKLDGAKSPINDLRDQIKRLDAENLVRLQRVDRMRRALRVLEAEDRHLLAQAEREAERNGQ